MTVTLSDVTISVDLIDKARRSDDLPPERKDPAFLRAALERYRRFLRLAMLHSDEPIAPSRDIDLMWHLHILSPRAYHEDCMAMFGDILDHDGGFGTDGAEEADLKRLFQRTALVWEAEFGEPYVGEPAMGMVKCTRNCVSRCHRRCKT